jgi:hypothetical protein
MKYGGKASSTSDSLLLTDLFSPDVTIIRVWALLSRYKVCIGSMKNVSELTVTAILLFSLSESSAVLSLSIALFRFTSRFCLSTNANGTRFFPVRKISSQYLSEYAVRNIILISGYRLLICSATTIPFSELSSSISIKTAAISSVPALSLFKSSLPPRKHSGTASVLSLIYFSSFARQFLSSSHINIIILDLSLLFLSKEPC